MALDPLEEGAGAAGVAGVDAAADSLDEVAVLDGAVAGAPAVLLPGPVPVRHAADRVPAVRVDADRARRVARLQRPQDRRQLRPLVRLYLPLQRLRYVSVWTGHNKGQFGFRGREELLRLG